MAWVAWRDAHELYEIRLEHNFLAVRLGDPQLVPVALQAVQQAHDTMAELMLTGAEGTIAAFHRTAWVLHHSLFLAAENRRLLGMRGGLPAKLDMLQVYGLRPETMIRLSAERYAAI